MSPERAPATRTASALGGHRSANTRFAQGEV